MIVVEEGALDRLAAYVPRPTLVVMDVNTEAVAGARVARELGADVLRLPADLHATEDAAAQVRARLRTGLVAVGSGTLTDIVRYAAHSAGCDFVSVPTAASMDGYASSVAAMERDGVKLTLRPGDTYVQNGTRHRWSNKGDMPAVLAVTLIGAEHATVR